MKENKVLFVVTSKGEGLDLKSHCTDHQLTGVFVGVLEVLRKRGISEAAINSIIRFPSTIGSVEATEESPNNTENSADNTKFYRDIK